MLELPCPHCHAAIHPYAGPVATHERCPCCRRFVRLRVALIDLAFWACVGALVGVLIAQVATSHSGYGLLVVPAAALVAALAAAIRGRRLVGDPCGDGSAVFLRAVLTRRDARHARYVLRASDGACGEAELDLRSGRVRLRGFRDPTRRARYAAYLERLFADYRPGQRPPAERRYAG